MRRLLLPVLFSSLFILESIFLEIMPSSFLNNDSILVPHFLMVGLLFLTVYGNRNYGIFYGFIFGALFDVVYTEIIGIYLFMFPLISYIIAKLMGMLQTNIVIVSLVSLLGVALLELGVYEMNFLIHTTNMDFPSFATSRLLPTVILNFIFIIIVSFPLKKQFEKWADQLRNE